MQRTQIRVAALQASGGARNLLAHQRLSAQAGGSDSPGCSGGEHFAALVLLSALVTHKHKFPMTATYLAQVVQYGADAVEAEHEAQRSAVERSLPYISPYDDLQVSGLVISSLLA